MRISDWSSDVCSSDLHSSALPMTDATMARRIICGEGCLTSMSISFLCILQSGFLCTVQPNRWCTISAKTAAPVADEPSSKRSEEHTSELQSLMRISYAVFCLKKKKKTKINTQKYHIQPN